VAGLLACRTLDDPRTLFLSTSQSALNLDVSAVRSLAGRKARNTLGRLPFSNRRGGLTALPYRQRRGKGSKRVAAGGLTADLIFAIWLDSFARIWYTMI